MPRTAGVQGTGNYLISSLTSGYYKEYNNRRYMTRYKLRVSR